MATKRRGPGNPPGSPWYSTPETARNRPSIKLTLSPEALALLDRLSLMTGKRRSRVVEDALAAYLPPRP